MADYAWTDGVADWKPLSDVLSTLCNERPKKKSLQTAEVPTVSTTRRRWAVVAAVIALVVAATIYELAPKLYHLATASRSTSKVEAMDVVSLAKQVRDAVVLLNIYDSKGKEIATGTGFFATPDGILVTNYHVIENAGRVVAKSENGAMYAVLGILAANPKADIALLRIDGKNLTFLALGDSQKAEVGQSVAVIGSPLGLEGTISQGIISAKRELVSREKWLQITAPISAGSSGSPVIDATGHVLGVATMLLRESQALNFAVPVEVPGQLLRGLEPDSVPIAFGSLPAVGEEIFEDKDFLAASRAYLAGDYANALSLMKLIQERFPKSELFYLLLGMTLAECGFTDDAIQAYQQSIKLKPDFDASWEGLAVAYQKQQRYEEAVAAIRQAIKINPTKPNFWDDLGAFYGDRKKFDDAISAFRQAAKLDPNDFDSCYGLGREYTAKNISAAGVEAIPWLQQAVRLKPNHAGAWMFLALNYAGLGKYGDAAAAYQQATRLKPGDHQSWYSLGCAYLNLRRPIDAIGPLQQATTLKPDDADSWKYLASAYYRTNQNQRAIEAYKRYKALSPLDD